jgi:hypothetical protein
VSPEFLCFCVLTFSPPLLCIDQIKGSDDREEGNDKAKDDKLKKKKNGEFRRYKIKGSKNYPVFLPVQLTGGECAGAIVCPACVQMQKEVGPGRATTTGTTAAAANRPRLGEYRVVGTSNDERFQRVLEEKVKCHDLIKTMDEFASKPKQAKDGHGGYSNGHFKIFFWAVSKVVEFPSGMKVQGVQPTLTRQGPFALAWTTLMSLGTTSEGKKLLTEIAAKCSQCLTKIQQDESLRDRVKNIIKSYVKSSGNLRGRTKITDTEVHQHVKSKLASVQKRSKLSQGSQPSSDHETSTTPNLDGFITTTLASVQEEVVEKQPERHKKRQSRRRGKRSRAVAEPTDDGLGSSGKRQVVDMLSPRTIDMLLPDIIDEPVELPNHWAGKRRHKKRDADGPSHPERQAIDEFKRQKRAREQTQEEQLLYVNDERCIFKHIHDDSYSTKSRMRNLLHTGSHDHWLGSDDILVAMRLISLRSSSSSASLLGAAPTSSASVLGAAPTLPR